MKARRLTDRGRRVTAAALVIACGLALYSCDIFGHLSAPESSDSALVRFIEPLDGSIDLSVYASDPGRSAYVVFTTGPSSGVPAPAASQPVGSRAPAAGNRGAAEMASDKRRAGFRNLARSFIPPASPRYASTGDPSADAVGDVAAFTLYGDAAGSTTAECRYVSGEVTFGEATRTLSIWVPDTEWSDLEGVGGKVSPDRVSALAEAFFGAEGHAASSIYAWVVGMLGPEWGGHGGTIRFNGLDYPLIPESENISILIADIDGDGSAFATNGGVVGYFYPGDAIPSFEYSNERVMFTVDSVMLGTAAGPSWELDDYWPGEVISTLAHEFQHMIHFYQKAVLRGGDYFREPTWMEELCSMQVEDLLADKLGLPGPRGVAPAEATAGAEGNTQGRLPEFLLWPDVSPLDWDDAPDAELTRYYSWAYAFGAYLTRNYGGAEFVRRVVQSPLADEGAVIAAAAAFSGRAETLAGLLRRWGAAALLSRRTDAPETYRYNSGGWFTSNVGGIEYRLGSIDMSNYLYANGIDSDGDGTGDTDLARPYVYTSTTIEGMAGGAYTNAFMDLGEPYLRPSWILEVPAGMYATIVVD